MMLLLNLPGDVGRGSTMATLAMMLSRRHWMWRDVAVESCWRWRCRGDVGRDAMSLPSHAGDGAVKVTWM
jgi:hypothetical protein